MDSKFISVIVPAHNEDKYISQCLESLSTQDYPKSLYEIIVVDNNSTDKTSEIASNFDVKIVQQASGPVGAVRNAGAKLANGELLAFIDADCVAPSEWLSKGSDLLKTSGSIFGGGCDLRSDPFWVEKAWLLKNKLPPRELLGCNIFINKSVFFEVGMFDETITSGEDTKLSIKLRNKDYHVITTKDLNVVHLGNPTTIKSFFLRQIWHSENYIQDWRESFRDPTFFLLIIFISGIILLALSAILQNTTSLYISITTIVGAPFLLTLKRLHRAKNLSQNLCNLPNIYFLDLVYLSGRIFGLIKSSRKAILRFIQRQNKQVD